MGFRQWAVLGMGASEGKRHVPSKAIQMHGIKNTILAPKHPFASESVGAKGRH